MKRDTPPRMESAGASGRTPATLDYRAVFAAGPDAYLVLSPDLFILDASDAYLQATMTDRAGIVGRHVFDAFPEDPADASTDQSANLRASVQHVLTHRRAHAMTVQRYPIRKPAAQGGAFEDRYWRVLNSPVLAADGRVQCIIHRVEDVTDSVVLARTKLDQDRLLRESEVRSHRYSDLLDSAPDAIVIVGEDGRIQLVNRQAETLFGYQREDLVTQHVEILIPERFRAAHVGHMSRYFSDPMARPMGVKLDLFGRRRDASEIPIEVSLSPQRSAIGTTVSAAIRDVSARKRLEAEARITADRLASAVDAIQDAFALFDANDQLVLCNSVFRSLVHGGDPGALVGRSYPEVLDAWLQRVDFPDDAARARFREQRIAQRMQREPTNSVDVRLQDGRRLRVIDRRTAEGGLVKTIWDLTEDEHRAEELREARAAAEAASAAKSDFLSSMSHELRTPLNAILGFAQLLTRDKREPLSTRHRERVEHILRGGDHLLRLIDDILDLSRIEAGSISLALEPVDVATVLSDVQRTLEPIATRQGISLEIDAGPEALPLVHADRTRFAQVLMNFGSNAIKYNRPSGTVRFLVGPIEERRIRITVTDTGIGIPADKQSKLFQPFQRAGQETGPIEGTGIGLVITKRLAELMGGAVGFRSTQGEGSAFWVEIPLYEMSAAASARTPEPERTTELATVGQHLVLYVEDNAANVMFMRDLMSSFDGVDLLTVPTAELGVELARARCPRVIIMDINLPGMSGLDALAALRADPATEHIPVIALTAAASPRDQAHGLEAGFHRYLTKPVRVDEFMAAMESLLQE